MIGNHSKEKLFSAVLLVLISVLLSLWIVLTSEVLLLFSLPFIAIAIVALLIGKPFASVLFFLLLMRPAVDILDSRFAGSISPNLLLGVAVLFLGFVVLIKYREVRDIPGLMPLSLLLLISLVPSLFVSPETTQSVFIWIRSLTYLPILMMAYCVVRHDGVALTSINIVLALSAVIPALAACIQVVIGIGSYDPYLLMSRPFGTFVHANTLSVYMTLAQIALLALLVEKSINKYGKAVLISLFCLNVFAIYITFSRVGWVIFAVSVFSFLFLISRSILRRVALGGMSLIGAALIYEFVPSIQQRFAEIFATKVSSTFAINSVAWRMKQWTYIYSIYERSPIIGNGFGIDYFLTRYYAHNDYVGMLASIGIVGFAAYLAVYFTIARKALFYQDRYPAATRTMIVLLLCIGLASITDNIFRMTPVQWFFWAYIGAAFGHIDREQASATTATIV